MFIVVKVNRTYTPGSDVKAAAYRAWNFSSLLRDAALRNQFKYLIAYYHGKVVGTFCIRGVAPDHEDVNRVKFLLLETNPECDKALRDIIHTINTLNPRKLKAPRSWLKFTCDDLMEFKIDCSKMMCDCAIDSIPLLETDEVQIKNK